MNDYLSTEFRRAGEQDLANVQAWHSMVCSPIVVALNPVVMFKKPRRGDVTDGEADEGVDVGVTVGVDVGMPVVGGDVG